MLLLSTSVFITDITNQSHSFPLSLDVASESTTLLRWNKFVIPGTDTSDVFLDGWIDWWMVGRTKVYEDTKVWRRKSLAQDVPWTTHFASAQFHSFRENKHCRMLLWELNEMIHVKHLAQCLAHKYYFLFAHYFENRKDYSVPSRQHDIRAVFPWKSHLLNETVPKLPRTGRKLCMMFKLCDVV